MKTLLSYFDNLAKKDGPDPVDFEELNAWYQTIGDQIRKGFFSREEIKVIRDSYGEIFSEKTLQGFAVKKPHGYAGDFEIIDRIYTKWISPEAKLSKWDRFFHSLEAVKAVRNRKEHFKKKLTDLEQSKPGRAITVLNVGSGPARDVYEYCCNNPSTQIIFECVDIDRSAINYAKTLCHEFTHRVVFHECNIFRFKTDTSYDLVWSAGLFDYLNDKVFKYLLNKLLGMVCEGGELAIGNFSTKNPNRDCMEFGEWYLSHRSSDDLTSLAMECNLHRDKVCVRAEPSGVNLFLHVN